MRISTNVCVCLCERVREGEREITASKCTGAGLSDITAQEGLSGQESQLDLNRVYQLDI